MKRIMTTMLAAACGLACLAQDAPAPRKASGPRARASDKGFKEKRQQVMRERMAAVRVSSFGKLADGTETKLYRLQGRGGLILDITDFGGRLVRCDAPDKYGNLADVTLGWNTPGEYEKLGFSMGTLIGRYGNRIADGKFTLEGK